MRIPRTFLQENGRKGGLAKSERKRKALNHNLKLARARQAELRRIKKAIEIGLVVTTA